GQYGMTGSSHVWIPDLGDEIWDLKGAGIFSVSLLGEKIRLNVPPGCSGKFSGPVLRGMPSETKTPNFPRG
ncbi:hypothetical protein AVEN_236781-1, partial [Araneus ventricosus]